MERKPKADVVTEKPEIYEKEVVSKPPVLISFNEFVGSIRNDYLIETLGGFINWMQKRGIQYKLPHEKWKEQLDTYVNRKV